MATRLGFIGFGIMGERLLRAALNHDTAVVTVSGGGEKFFPWATIWPI